MKNGDLNILKQIYGDYENNYIRTDSSDLLYIGTVIHLGKDGLQQMVDQAEVSKKQLTGCKRKKNLNSPMSLKMVFGLLQLLENVLELLRKALVCASSTSFIESKKF